MSVFRQSNPIRLQERNYPTQQNSLPVYSLICVSDDPAVEIGSDGAGGQNVYVRELGLALAQRGCQVDMFTRREDPNQPAIVEHAPGCRTIRLSAGPARFIPRTELFNYLPEFVEAWLQFQRRFCRNYVLIHTNYWLSGWVGLQLKHRLGLPLVHTNHSLAAVEYREIGYPPVISPTRLLIERTCLEKADCVVATSPQEAASLRQLVSLGGRILVIPCGIDTQHFAFVERDLARQQLGIAPATPLILYVGRFARRKGIETLVRACAQLPQSQSFKLHLVGGSRFGEQDVFEQKRIKALVAKLGLAEVTVFMGHIPQAQLPPYYAAADVCVVPSYYDEPLGLVAIEAMAAGTPVIASNVGGLQHSVAHGKTGMLVPPGDPDALAAALADVLESPRRWQYYGYAAWKWVRSRFSRTDIAAQIHQLYESLTYSPPANGT